MALAGDIVRRKALNLLVERAEVKDEDSPEEQPSGKPEQEPGEATEAISDEQSPTE